MSTHTHADHGRTARPKSVLFCPECGHESVASGDWTVHERDGRRVFACPVCGTTIATRSAASPACHC